MQELVMPERIPIACSLDGSEAGRRWREWSSVMAFRLSVERSPQLLTMRFPPSIDLLRKLGELVAAESECCGFVAWGLEDLETELMLTVRGDIDGVAAMAESFGISP